MQASYTTTSHARLATRGLANKPLLTRRVSVDQPFSIGEPDHGLDEEDSPFDCLPSNVGRSSPPPIPSEITIDDHTKRRCLTPPRQVPTKFPRTSSAPTIADCKQQAQSKTRLPRERFESILDRPFTFWRELNAVLETIFPQWQPRQRGRMIHHLVHFLELKVGMDEYIPTGMILPTPVVDQAWRALVLETTLYDKISHAIQDFHDKPRGMLHYTLFSNKASESQDKLRRTQSLFQVYFKETMPLTIEEAQCYQPKPSYQSNPFHVSTHSNSSSDKEQTPASQNLCKAGSLQRKGSSFQFSLNSDDDTEHETVSITSVDSDSLMGLEWLE